VAIFNANPQGDGTHGPYGLPAPRPTWLLPAERRTNDQIDQSFRQDGPNEYHALRDFTWSSTENVFYGADEQGIFKLTPQGESTFVGHPGGIQPKGISFFTVSGQRRLLLGERNGPTLSTIDPMTGQVVGNPVTLMNEAMQPLAGILSLAEHPDGTTLYGISNIVDGGGDSAARELVRINPVTGATTAVGILDTGDAFMADLAFVFIDAPLVHTWNVDANGNWSTASNWTNGEPNAVGDAASFAGVITAPRTVTVDGPKTVGSLTFNNAQSYTLAGTGPLTINSNAAATIEVTSGSHTISAPLSIAAGKTVTKSGAGTLTISGTQTHGAGAVLTASAGTTNLNSDAGTNLSLVANAAVNLGATQHLGGVQIGAGATVQLTTGPSKSLVTPTLTIAGTPAAPTGKLDLATNSAIVNYTGTSPEATIRQQIIAGRGGPGLGKTWNGQGITSSAAATADPESRSVGYAENATLPLGPLTTFRGQPVDNTTVLMAFTRTADANLDGVVNDDDVTIVGASYAPGVAGASWAVGDFDYNGFVDDDDVTLMGALYEPGAPPITPPAGAGVAAVPEPGTIALLVTGLIAIPLGLVVRRKSRSG
jgi:autotransporter-associated beta strand protein